MQVRRFELERWQSVWENQVELNLSESGVQPLSVRELVENSAALDRLLAVPLGYPQTNGTEELRERIAALYPGAGPENVLVTNGCAEANFLLTWALLEPGDVVVFMQPNYMQIGGLVHGLGARVRPLWLRDELRWAPNLDDLAKLVTEKTRLLAVCNPNNPTGAVLTLEAMEAVCAAASRTGAHLLADEVYRGAEREDELTPSFFGRYERAVCTGGLSKAYGLPGLRTGWIVGPAELIERLWSHKDYTTIAATTLSDRLAALALEPARRRRLLERTRSLLRRNYPLVCHWIEQHAGRLTHVPPAAGAIAWVGCPGMDTATLAETALAQQSVLLTPGEQFGMPGYLRIGYGGDAGHLHEALARLDKLLA